MSPSTNVQKVPASAQLLQMIMGKWVSAAISAAAELGIADQLAGGDKTVDELAAATSAHAPSLYRLLRSLASVGIFAETQTRRFTLTPLAQCLRSDVPDSMREMARFSIMPAAWQAWGELVHSVKTGESGVRKAFAVDNPFDYFKDHPEEAAIFDGAMTDMTRQTAPGVAQAYDFGRFGTLMDVAGGRGFLLATILKRHPNLRGILLELPHVAESARQTFAAEDLDYRCQVVSGDFIESVPPGADAYLMKHIIHDWDDAHALTILRNIHKVIQPSGRLLLVETVVPTGNEPSFAKLLDLEMMVLPGGLERTRDEYRDLFAAAGFRLLEIYPSHGPESIIEGVPLRD